ncbi:MAG TPA: alpha/beta fold hydrolase [Casimicrobiaceae bacterium]|nr:alpha/beta fold hydrolase [Casimicrobiaceae bacterium]
MKDAASRRYRVNGIELNVAVEGDGPPLLLVHGFPDDHTVWRKQIPALVAAGYRVIAPDTRGCGDSDAPVGTRHYTIDLLVSDLVALLDTLRIDKVRLVAHDWGAGIAWALAMRHPERVDRYAALSVGHLSAYAHAGLEQKLKGWYILFLQLRGFAEWLLRLGDWWLFRAVTRYREEAPHWIESLSRPGRLTAAINYYRANIGMILPRKLPHVTVPVMGVWSSGDAFLAESQMVESKRYVNALFRYERIEGANHWLQLTAPDRVNALLLDFLR